MFEFMEDYHDEAYFVMRVLAGLLFMQHGAQKLFGVLGGEQAQLVSQMGIAGVIEFFGGLFITIGLFTRLAAVLGGLEMLWAYFTVHISESFWPILNGGEGALLFFTVFLIFMVHGAKKWGVDNLISATR